MPTNEPLHPSHPEIGESTSFLSTTQLPDSDEITDNRKHYLVVIDDIHGAVRYELGESPMTVGRGADCDVQISDPSISKRHCRIESQGLHTLVTDLNSTNGVYLNGRRVQGAALWPAEATLRIGNRFVAHEYRDPREVEQSEELAGDLERASRYVSSLLPDPLDQATIKTDWTHIPCSALGGDVFGYHWIDPDHFAIYLVDVCGHGVGAAMHSVAAINTIRQQTLPDVDFTAPAEVLVGLNRVLDMDRFDGMFFTVWYGVYRPADRTLTYSSGGHPPALLIGPAGEPVRELKTPGLPIGSIDTAAYAEARATVNPDDVLHVYSDGVYEITVDEGRDWRFAEFVELVKTEPAGIAGRSRRIHQKILALNNEERFPDDFSLVAVHFV